jgi:hypothetical protein
MRNWVSLALAFALVATATVTMAEEKAATQELPAALQALAVQSDSVVSVKEAQEVRGQWVYETWQEKEFSVTGGVAVGTTNIIEGVVGAFTFTQLVPGGDGIDPASLVVEGTFGGLQGIIGVTADGGLAFNMQGKAFQETLDFSGLFEQTFSQYYAAPLLGISK